MSMKYVIKVFDIDTNKECTLPELFEDKELAIIAGHQFCEHANLKEGSIYCYFRAVLATKTDLALVQFYKTGYPIYD